jgi:2-C-methyl-D-erythritol 4-phosphate cytidylyltransferase
MSTFVTAVIVAAGGSTRMGLGRSKQFIELCGKPVIAHTLTAFENADIIDSVVVVCREQDMEEIMSIAHNYGCGKVCAFVKGGSTRYESVRNGLSACDERTTHIAIHDGARPLISVEDIDKVVRFAFAHKAAALGTPVTDTIKVVDADNVIVSTPARATLRAVQTPQVFEKSLYLRALETAEQNNESITDDCMLIESIGEKVFVVDGSERNIKLTTQNDILLAEVMMKGDC